MYNYYKKYIHTLTTLALLFVPGFCGVCTVCWDFRFSRKWIIFVSLKSEILTDCIMYRKCAGIQYNIQFYCPESIRSSRYILPRQFWFSFSIHDFHLRLIRFTKVTNLLVWIMRTRLDGWDMQNNNTITLGWKYYIFKLQTRTTKLQICNFRCNLEN